MRLEVYLYAQLRDRTPQSRRGRPVLVDLPAAATGEQLLELLGISPGEAALFLVNGQHRGVGTTLAPGDRVAVFPLVGGG